MANDLAARFRRWFEYERDAHARVFDSFATVPPAGRETPEYRKAVAVMAHGVAARRMWLARLGAVSAPSGPLFPAAPGLDRVASEWGEVQRLWGDFLAGLDDEALAREFTYQSLDAGRFRNTVEDILAQLFGHSWYHRGQVASLVRAAGGQPAVTDLIFWCRELVPDPGTP